MGLHRFIPAVVHMTLCSSTDLLNAHLKMGEYNRTTLSEGPML